MQQGVNIYDIMLKVSKPSTSLIEWENGQKAWINE